MSKSPEEGDEVLIRGMSSTGESVTYVGFARHVKMGVSVYIPCVEIEHLVPRHEINLTSTPRTPHGEDAGDSNTQGE